MKLYDLVDDFANGLDGKGFKHKKFWYGLLTFIFVAGTFIAVMICCIIFGRINAAQEICENLDMIPVKDPLLDNELTCVHEDRFWTYKPESEPLPFEFNWNNKSG